MLKTGKLAVMKGGLLTDRVLRKHSTFREFAKKFGISEEHLRRARRGEPISYELALEIEGYLGPNLIDRVIVDPPAKHKAGTHPRRQTAVVGGEEIESQAAQRLLDSPIPSQHAAPAEVLTGNVPRAFEGVSRFGVTAVGAFTFAVGVVCGTLIAAPLLLQDPARAVASRGEPIQDLVSVVASRDEHVQDSVYENVVVGPDPTPARVIFEMGGFHSFNSSYVPTTPGEWRAFIAESMGGGNGVDLMMPLLHADGEADEPALPVLFSLGGHSYTLSYEALGLEAPWRRDRTSEFIAQCLEASPWLVPDVTKCEALSLEAPWLHDVTSKPAQPPQPEPV